MNRYLAAPKLRKVPATVQRVLLHPDWRTDVLANDPRPQPKGSGEAPAWSVLARDAWVFEDYDDAVEAAKVTGDGHAHAVTVGGCQDPHNSCSTEAPARRSFSRHLHRDHVAQAEASIRTAAPERVKLFGYDAFED